MSLIRIKILIFFLLKKVKSERIVWALVFLGVILIQSVWLYFTPFYRQEFLKGLPSSVGIGDLAVGTCLMLSYFVIIFLGMGLVQLLLRECFSIKRILFFFSLPLKKQEYFWALFSFSSIFLFAVFLGFYLLGSSVIFIKGYNISHFFERILSGTIFVVLLNGLYMCLGLFYKNVLGSILFIFILGSSFFIEDIKAVFMHSPSLLKFLSGFSFVFLPRFHSLIWTSIYPAENVVLRNFVFMHSFLLILLLVVFSRRLFLKSLGRFLH